MPSTVTLLLWALALASCWPRAVRRAAAGAPALLLGLGALWLLPVLLVALQRWLRPRAWCRIVPDPAAVDFAPLVAGLQAAAAEALASRRPIAVDLLPWYDDQGQCRPYDVSLAPAASGRRASPPAGDIPAVHLSFGAAITYRDAARFRVAHPAGVRLRFVPDQRSKHGLTVRHDAPPLRPDLRFLNHPFWPALAAALLLWNLCRHGPYAPLNPSLPVWLLITVAGWTLHNRDSRRSSGPTNSAEALFF